MILSTLYGFLKLSRSHNEGQGQLLSQHGRSCPPYDTVVKFKDFQLKIQKSQPCTAWRPVRGAPCLSPKHTNLKHDIMKTVDARLLANNQIEQMTQGAGGFYYDYHVI